MPHAAVCRSEAATPAATELPLYNQLTPDTNTNKITFTNTRKPPAHLKSHIHSQIKRFMFKESYLKSQSQIKRFTFKESDLKN